MTVDDEAGAGQGPSEAELRRRGVCTEAERIDRTLALLWRDRDTTPPEPTRGRRPTLTIGQIIRAAIGVADADGLTATSMHRVAKELGAGTMTLYTYVPGKTELVDLMVDDVLVERGLPGPGEPRSGDWRAQVELYSDRTREAHRRHPWLREMSRVRPALGPGQLAGQEYVLSTVDGLGLSPRETVAAANSITSYVDANATLEAESIHLERSTGQSTDAWWNQRSAFWTKYFDITAHPAMNATWLAGGFATTAGEQAAAAYEFGLARLLDGIAHQAARATG
ncbi:TetR/AcrR family transcriptional regulator [Amycolatopsis sp. NPDC051903]|uniref:TetR/AcrR family transcriptional regulator n=1 Tax=Amycolatopsis sp. NPDC051903 TaxID=3363936 RepID=UPI0037B968D9